MNKNMNKNMNNIRKIMPRNILQDKIHRNYYKFKIKIQIEKEGQNMPSEVELYMKENG